MMINSYFKNKKIAMLFAGIAVLAMFLLIDAKSFALDYNYFDDSGATCDVSNCASTSVELVAGQTQYVRRSGAFVRAYYDANVASELTIHGYNYCPGQSGNHDATQGGDRANGTRPASGTDVTRFRVNGIDHFGKRYASTSARCDDDLIINIPVGSLTPDPDTGLFYVNVNVDHLDQTPSPPYDGIMNYFSVSETGSTAAELSNRYKIAQKSGSSGYEVTLQQSTGPSNSNYRIYFGADCSITGPTAVNLFYYDMDNDGGAGAQLGGKVTMRLYNDDTNALIDSWTPPTDNNNTGNHGFTARPEVNYRWEINNVYENNTLQFSTPFDGIYFFRDCPTPPPDNSGAYTITTSALEHEKGSGDKTIGATFAVNTRPCSGSLPIGTPIVIVWSIIGPGIAAPIAATSATVTIPNCSGPITGATSLTRQVSGAVLDGLPTPTTVGPVGPYRGTIISSTIPPGSVTSPPVSIIVVTVPYVRFYGNDVSAAGCGSPTLPVPAGSPSSLYGGIVANRKTAEIPLPTKQETPEPDGSTTAYPLGNKFGGAASEYAAIALNGKQNTILTGIFQSDNSSSPIKLQAYWLGNASCPGVQFGEVKAAIKDLTATTEPIDGDNYIIRDIPISETRYIKGAGRLVVGSVYPTAVAGKQTIYANGDIYINQNIVTNITSGTFDTNTAPYILIIAEGNIYIAPGVSTINAMLVAKGDIYTCSNDAGTGGQPQGDIERTIIAPKCSNKLTINGGLLANYIHFQRSGGTRLLANDSEQSTAGAGLGTAAEVVNFPYYMYFTSPYLTDQANASFQAYFSPAPYF